MKLTGFTESAWAISGFIFKICFGIWLLLMALDSSESFGSRIVATLFILMIWLSVLDSSADHRHREILAKLEQIRLGDRSP